MNKTFILAAATVALGLAVTQARAEGNNEPFPFSAPAQVSTGHAFVTETGSAHYPQLTGEVTCASDYDQILPANSNEALIQTVNSLPGHTVGTTAFAQADGGHQAGSVRAR